MQLNKGVCIVSFSEESQAFYCNMLKPAWNIDSITEKHCIRNLDAILGLPPMKLFVLFVDYNNRNVILEEPGLGLGDLRLTTVRAIKKMEGKIIIIYAGDPGSKQLEEHNRYNTHLASVTTQQELVNLNNEHRVFSAKDSLSKFQINELKGLIENDIKISR